jgi:hypothetical protein
MNKNSKLNTCIAMLSTFVTHNMSVGLQLLTPAMAIHLIAIYMNTQTSFGEKPYLHGDYLSEFLTEMLDEIIEFLQASLIFH